MHKSWSSRYRAGGWYTAPSWNTTNLGCSLYGFKIDVVPEDRISIDKVIGAIRDATSYYREEGYQPIHASYGVHIINCSWGYEDTLAYLPDLQRAFNYAYEHGVSIVCSRGNFQEQRVQYPACFDPSWITSVGGHDSGNPPNDPPIRDGESRWGGYMDILAPSLSQDIYTTQYLGGWRNFGYTSAAAPHVAGAIGLLRSDFLRTPHPSNPDNITLESEDYENMLKAAALDLNYDPNNQNIDERTYDGYDNVSGWGQLKVGKIFQMLQDGYIIKHYTLTANTPPQYPLNDYNIQVIKEGRRNDCLPGQYNIRQRTITGNFDLENNWVIDATHNLYVWGRNGRTTRGGFSAGNPLFLTSYTEVTSGEQGNGLIPGIVHNNNTTVNAKTYQYELRNINTKQRIQDLPTNDNLELYITVFGKPTPTSVENVLSVNEQALQIIPNPAFNYFVIRYNTVNQAPTIIKIYDLLGNIVYEIKQEKVMSGTFEINIDANKFCSGIYSIELIQANTITRNKLVIFN